MEKRPKFRSPSHATVVAYLALFVALGGSAFAATQLGKNTVGTKQIKKNAVTGVKVKDGSLSAGDFAAGQIPAGPVGPPGPKGEPGATNAVFRYGPNREINTGTSSTSFAACKPGEAVTGGGWTFPGGRPNNHEYFVTGDRPAVVEEQEGEPPFFGTPPEGSKATGWLTGMENSTGAPFHFQSYVICASP
jgi:hypothetical protein